MNQPVLPFLCPVCQKAYGKIGYMEAHLHNKHFRTHPTEYRAYYARRDHA